MHGAQVQNSNQTSMKPQIIIPILMYNPTNWYMHITNLYLHAALHQENLVCYIRITIFGAICHQLKMELWTYTGISGINYFQCFVQSYCFINSKHKQTNDFFKNWIWNNEFSGFQNSKIKVTIFKKGEIHGHKKPNSYM